MAVIINVTGIVLREVSYKESDKILSVLTKEKGNISIYAHGARKLDSPLFSSCQLYSYSNFSVYEAKGKYHLKECSLIESFYNLRKTLEGSALSSYIAETALDISQEEQKEENLLRLVLNSLYCIAGNIKPYWQIKGTYEIRCCAEIGYMPETDACEKCGKKDIKSAFLNITQGYMLCPDCYHKGSENVKVDELEGIYLHPSTIIEITPGVAKAIDYITKARLEKIFSFVIQDSDIRLFVDVCEKFFKSHLEREYSSLSFYNSIL